MSLCHTHIYEMATLFIVIEISSVTPTQNCATIYNGTIIALSIDIVLPGALWPWVDLTSDRNKYQGYFLVGKGSRCVGLTTLPPSCAE